MSGTGSKPEPTLKENLEKLKKLGNKTAAKEVWNELRPCQWQI